MSHLLQLAALISVLTSEAPGDVTGVWVTGLTSHMTGDHTSDTAGDWGAETVHIVHIRYGEIHPESEILRGYVGKTRQKSI